MSRSVAFLPFEVSRQAPEPLRLEEDANFDAEAEEDSDALADGDEEFAGGEAFAGDARDDEETPAPGEPSNGGSTAGEASVEERAGETGAAADGALGIEAAAGDSLEPDATADIAAGLAAGTPASEEPSPLGENEASEDFEGSGNSEDSEYSEKSEDSEDSKTFESWEDGTGAEAGARERDHAGEEGAVFAGEASVEGEAAVEGDADFADELFDEDVEWLARSDRLALAGWIRDELAAIFASTGALRPILLELDEDELAEAEELDDLELPLSPEPGAAAAAEVGAELGLACRLRADSRSVELSGLLSDLEGEERVRFALVGELGEAWLLPRRAARELLLALGEDAAAGALGEIDEREAVDPEAVLGLCRGARSLAEAARAPAGDPLADPLPGLGELLAALVLAPGLVPARELLLRGAEAAAEGATMPAWLGALEQLALMFPADAQVLAALAAYRRLHHDKEGARDLLLRARDLASQGAEEAAVLAQLAALAEEDGRVDEALQHLRAAVRVDDDAAIYMHLGRLLRERDPQESVRAFQRALVLEPQSAAVRLWLARQLRAVGEIGRAATEAARAAQLAGEDRELAEAAAALLRELAEEART